MPKVEFRFLQFIVSHVTGDRVTLGLVHWDGERCRVAQSFTHVDFCGPEQLGLIKQTAKAKLKRAKRAIDKAARAAAKQGGHGFLLGLASLLVVREGTGAAMYWSPIETSFTGDPEAHFEMLRVQTRLTDRPKSASGAVTNRDLSHQLLTKLNKLHEAAPNRVLLSNKVQRLQDYTAPVSWKNGLWHHAIPFSLDGADPAGMARRARDLVGLVQLCIPLGDVPVPIIVYPESPALAEAARAEVRIVEEGLADRKVSLMTVGRSDEGLALGGVFERVRVDAVTEHDA